MLDRLKRRSHRSTSLRGVFFWTLSCAVLSACGDDAASGGGGGAPSDDGGGGAVAQGGAAMTGGGGAGAGEPECEPPEGTRGRRVDVAVDTATVAAVDELGDPIASFDVLFCGVDLCLYSTTNLIGQAIFNNSQDTLDRPYVKTGESLVYGKIGYPWTPDAPSPFPVMFPQMEDSRQQLAAGTTVAVGGVEVAVPEGGVAAIDELIHDSEDKKTFRVGRVPVEQVAFATGRDDFEMVYTLGPIDTLFCPPAAATFENYADLPPGAAVEIFAQELAVGEFFGPYGAWSKIADGAVSDDGATITTAEEGLPALLTIAIKLAR
jgi:hypothetical protein